MIKRERERQNDQEFHLEQKRGNVKIQKVEGFLAVLSPRIVGAVRESTRSMGSASALTRLELAAGQCELAHGLQVLWSDRINSVLWDLLAWLHQRIYGKLSHLT